jgi:hypothetical protein
MYADAKLDAPRRQCRRVAFSHGRLDCRGAAQRIDGAGKFHKHAIAGGLDDAATMRGDLQVDQLAAMGLELLVRPFLVCAHQPRVAGHIGGQDRGETADSWH